ncbi:MAG: MBL fold metallo-hydrolase [Dehalococcoidia bacterium]
MDIAWIGHAAFRLRGRDAAVVMDPCPSSTGFRLNRPQADIVTISTTAPAYAWSDGVAGKPIRLDAPGEYEIKNVLLTGVPAPAGGNGEGGGQRTVAFVVEIDDVIVAHLGDMRVAPTANDLDELSRADVLLVPVGGHGHMDAQLAADVVATLEPKLVIPMLFKVGPETEVLDPVDPFLKAMSAAPPSEPDNHLNVTRSSLPGHTTVHVFAPRGES